MPVMYLNAETATGTLAGNPAGFQNSFT
jgi:hypothetical protein